LWDCGSKVAKASRAIVGDGGRCTLLTDVSRPPDRGPRCIVRTRLRNPAASRCCASRTALLPAACDSLNLLTWETRDRVSDSRIPARRIGRVRAPTRS
jgi:hypothetical protein